MTKNIMATEYKILAKKVRNLLLTEWDPIGIADFPECQDEYDNYVPRVCRLIMEKAGKKEIFNFLWEVETERMGLGANSKKTEIFAKKLSEL